MAKIEKIMEFMDSIAPFNTAMSWDNCGLLVESTKEDIEKITVCLDITPDIVRKATQDGTDLIISHHPVIFAPIKKITNDSAVSCLVRSNIAAICAHTNLDISSQGVNTALANALNVRNITPFEGEEAIGVYGDLEKPMDRDTLCRYIKEKLNAEYVMLTEAQNRGNDKKISRIAMCSGSGAEFISCAEQCGADAFLTGEVKHHELLEARQGNIDLIAAGHFATEKVVVKPLADMLKKQFPECDVQCADDREPVKIF